MSTHWMLKTKGDPLGTVHRFVRDVWQAAGLDALVIPPNAKGQKHILTDPAGLEEVNPFQPLMLMNMAKVIPDVLKEHKDGRAGVLLRPCEMRALTEIARRGAVQTNSLLTLCVDCLGTFPEDEFEWRAARKGSEKGLTGEALQFAPQGGISAYRYRATLHLNFIISSVCLRSNGCSLAIYMRLASDLKRLMRLCKSG